MHLKVCECWPGLDWNLSNLSIVLPVEFQSYFCGTQRQWFKETPKLWSGLWIAMVCLIITVPILLVIFFSPILSFLSWDWMWKCNTNPRIKCFLWVNLQQRLATKDNLLILQVTQDDMSEMLFSYLECKPCPQRLSCSCFSLEYH